jgi:Cu-Zn family superoxide dismutase
MMLSSPSRKGRVVGLSLAFAASLALAAALLMLLVTPAAGRPPAPFAWAQIIDTAGEPVGSARFTQKRGTVRISAFAVGLTPGKHGIHIHTVGECDPNAVDPATGATVPFFTAGTHFNPYIKEHGLQNPRGPHAGDLPNLVAREDGVGSLRAKTGRVSLRPDVANSLFDSDRSALVIHAAEDDQRTDPTGNSGARIACGVIQSP